MVWPKAQQTMCHPIGNCYPPSFRLIKPVIPHELRHRGFRWGRVNRAHLRSRKMPSLNSDAFSEEKLRKRHLTLGDQKASRLLSIAAESMHAATAKCRLRQSGKVQKIYEPAC
jgi:hypothetical protein